MLKQLKRWSEATRVSAFAKDESGAALVEYGLLVALIAAACAVTIQLLGGTLNALFVAINGFIAGVPLPGG